MDSEAEIAAHPGARPRVHLALFLATLTSVFLAGEMQVGAFPQAASGRELLGKLPEVAQNLPRGWTFAVPMMAILVCHELGHYVAARIHRVPASLPYFIPLPFFSLFGTMGAVISMPQRIRSRNALLDIGAAGPLAGVCVAIPVITIGLRHCPVLPAGGGFQEGQSLLYLWLKRVVFGTIPPGHDVFLTPTALAGWAGLFITVLNLLPIGQLDGGHIAYALFGPRQDKVALALHLALPALFLYNLALFRDVTPGLIWIVWFVLLALLRRMTGANHPPTEPGELSGGRRAIAVGCLVLFALLFMPTPMREADPPLLKSLWSG